jgi:TP901 family phage tail tape measure protein
MNTARWQISSSILHGFMGALQGAYGYAQDLNESLNNIRIVTGASVEEMTAFADRANKAAQALSTTTTQYTDAALIYYQQGIRDQEEIAGRVESTIKLANVSRQSAEEVSDQLTAIWNNFYDGSKSLEYYADVITALGAATASSSEEISTGLQKFAAVADTVGLSYEYATSALATITATTRQSADTVGTGLRTLFTRLQGLKLGETLEDGVDLNKYSKALDTVGVQILDVTGEMKDMDTILDELGQRWGDLSDAQKTALAQTVGGVRQYTNLIALMDNWDFMQENLAVASGSEGTLQEQADIYAESWEAAQKRVKAALEAIYGELLDDKFFIELTNTLADVINKVDDVIQKIQSARVIDRLVDKSRQNELERRR